VEEVERAVLMAELKTTIEEFPKGLQTVIGERGVTLSSGQRQRLALARALLVRPNILLLDDALSNVDVATEEAIIEHLQTMKGEITIIMASHRLSAAVHADNIVVLEEGRVVEQGTHGELAGRHGLYARLVQKQQLETALDRETVKEKGSGLL